MRRASCSAGGNHPAAREGGDCADRSGRMRWPPSSLVGPTDCSGYGGPFCTYPWYAFNRTLGAFTYGGDYPGTSNDFGRALQFQQTKDCTSPKGGNPQYCSTILK